MKNKLPRRRMLRRLRLWLALRLLPADVYADLTDAAETWWSERERGNPEQFRHRMRLVRWLDSRAPAQSPKLSSFFTPDRPL